MIDFGIGVLMDGKIGIKKQHFVLEYAFVYARVYICVSFISRDACNAGHCRMGASGRLKRYRDS